MLSVRCVVELHVGDMRGGMPRGLVRGRVFPIRDERQRETERDGEGQRETEREVQGETRGDAVRPVGVGRGVPGD